MQDSFDLLSVSLRPPAVRVSVRKHQRLPLSPGAQENGYLITKGIFLVRAPIAQSRHQVLGILYPGDFIRAGTLPPLEGMMIMAASEANEAQRVRWPAAKEVLNQKPEFARWMANRLADQVARTALHNAIIAGLTGDERVAALVIELALRTGTKAPAGYQFEMPLSRTDIAEHLSLNADTVSRIVSRMRANRMLVPAGRRHLLFANVDKLAETCPLSAAVISMHSSDEEKATPRLSDNTAKEPESA